MKILLDENIDVRFKYRLAEQIPEHEFLTIRDMGWKGMKNGLLIKSLKEHGFDLLIAVDKNMPFQQSAYSLEIIVLVLDVKRNILPALMLLISSIQNFLKGNPAPGFYVING